MADFLLYALTGAFVGFLVGISGVGGGSLMTPALLLYGFPPSVAIGTDLLYAAVTKTAGAVAHARLGHVDLRILLRLAAGSLPGALAALAALWALSVSGARLEALLTTVLGFMLILTAACVALRSRILAALARRDGSGDGSVAPAAAPRLRTMALGAALGVLVTLSSVGTGAVAAAVLLLLYPGLAGRRVVGTDIAHAVPLTLIGGLGHLALGNVDPALLLALVSGSLPAIHVGARCAAGIPDRVMRITLMLLLGVVGSWLVFR